MEKHLAYVRMLFNQGNILIGGAATDEPIGILVLRVDSEKEARQIYEHDSAVIARIGYTELHPFRAGMLAGPGNR
jgi:hypothetical protein